MVELLGKTNRVLLILLLTFLSSIAYSSSENAMYNIVSDYKIIVSDIKVVDQSRYEEIKAMIKGKYKTLGYADVPVIIKGNEIEIMDASWEINEVIIKGIEEEKKPEVERIMELSGGLLSGVSLIQGTSLLNALKNIELHYVNNGYPDIKIDYNVINDELEVNLDTGSKIKILSVNIRSDLRNTELFDKINQLLEKESLHSNSKIHTAVRMTKTYLDNNGYADGKISVNINRISEKYEIISLSIFGNGVKLINKVKLYGWNLGKEYNFKHLKEGGVYKVKDLQNEIRSLKLLQLHEEIKYGVVVEGGLVNINIALTPRKTTTIYVGAEVQNDRSTAILRLTEKNFLNKGWKFVNLLSFGSDESKYISAITLEDDVRLSYSYKKFDMTGDTFGIRHQLTYQKNNNPGNKYFQIYGITEDCDTCVVSYGVGLGSGKTWEFVDNTLDPRDGSVTKISGDLIFKSKSIGLLGDFRYTLYNNKLKPLYVKNDLLVGVGRDESYVVRNRNKVSIRGYTPSTHNQDNNIVIRNSTDIYGVKSIFDTQIKFGAYLDLYDEKKNRSNQEIVSGLSARIFTSRGDIEIYRGLYSKKNIEQKLGLTFSQKF